jgi:hypothetical protein
VGLFAKPFCTLKNSYKKWKRYFESVKVFGDDAGGRLPD